MNIYFNCHHLEHLHSRHVQSLIDVLTQAKHEIVLPSGHHNDNSGIQQANLFIFIITPKNIASHLHQQEFLHAIQNGLPTLPILLTPFVKLPVVFTRQPILDISSGISEDIKAPLGRQPLMFSWTLSLEDILTGWPEINTFEKASPFPFYKDTKQSDEKDREGDHTTIRIDKNENGNVIGKQVNNNTTYVTPKLDSSLWEKAAKIGFPFTLGMLVEQALTDHSVSSVSRDQIDSIIASHHPILSHEGHPVPIQEVIVHNAWHDQDGGTHIESLHKISSYFFSSHQMDDRISHEKEHKYHFVPISIEIDSKNDVAYTFRMEDGIHSITNDNINIDHGSIWEVDSFEWEDSNHNLFASHQDFQFPDNHDLFGWSYDWDDDS